MRRASSRLQTKICNDSTSFNFIVDDYRKEQEETIEQFEKVKKAILKEIRDMRAEWDMGALKQNILNDSRGNSQNWSKWHAAFRGKQEKLNDN